MGVVARVTFTFVFLMVALRVIGKRELSQLSPFELITLLLIPDIFQQALIRDDFSVTSASVAAATLLSLVYITSLLSYRFKRVGRLMEGAPAVLAHDGALVPRQLDRQRVSPEDIFAEMHRAGLERLDQVRWVILGTDGRIAVVPKATPGLPVNPPEGHPLG